MAKFDRRSTALEVAAHADLRGRRVVVTGASSGIGAATAEALAACGADLVFGVRDIDKGEAVAEPLRRRGAMVHVLPLDLGDFDSVEAFSASLRGPVDRLIANAGVSKTPEAHLPNGLEVRIATNHLGHFLLAHRLLANLRGRSARIVVLSSAAHKGMPIHLDDLQWTQRPHLDGAAYAESKSANILFTVEAARRWRSDDVRCFAVLPGSALTGLQRFHGEALKRRIGFIDEAGRVDPMVKTSEQAAATSVWAATSATLDEASGWVLEDCARAEIVRPETHRWSGFDPAIADGETAAALWEASALLLRKMGHPLE